jgi:signal transduction histidine kinase
VGDSFDDQRASFGRDNIQPGLTRSTLLAQLFGPLQRPVQTVDAYSQLIPAARHITFELLSAWRIEHAGDEAALVVTELVSNVIDHVGGDTTLVLELAVSGGWLTISIADGSAVRPVVRELCEDQPRGRGMQLVAGVADRWGCDDQRGGKRVWAQLRTEPTGS